MCDADTMTNDDGTFSAVCYCGWSDHGHATIDSAERAAEAHQNGYDATETATVRDALGGFTGTS